ncbi:hypothetical protein D3C73_711290 [compost metagenome]
MKAPTAIMTRAIEIGFHSFIGLRVKALTRVPAAVAISMTTNRPCICCGTSPICCRKPTAPVVCSDNTIRTSRIASRSRTRSRPASHLRSISGLVRLYSIRTAAVSSTIAPARAQPIHAASVHQTMRPRPSTAVSRATPGANRAKVTKSSFSNTRTRCDGGILRAKTAGRATSTSPSSNM